MRHAALDGVLLWTIYGVSECWAANILPRILARHSYEATDRSFLLLLAVAYPLIGGIVGGLAGALSASLTRLRAFLDVDARNLAFAGQIIVVATVVLIEGARKIEHAPMVLNASVIAAVAWTLADLARNRRRFWLPMLSILVPDAIAVSVLTPGPMRFAAASVLAISAAAWLTRGLGQLSPVVMSAITIASFASAAVLPPVAMPAALPLSRARPNIVLIVMDTVRSDHTSLYGYRRDTTPALRQFSQVVTMYSNAFSPGDMTLSSHASMFTGVYPTTHGAYPDSSQSREHGYSRPLSDDWPTLAGLLRRADYRTIGIAANYGYLSDFCGLNRGFEEYEAREGNPLGVARNHMLRAAIRTVAIRFLPVWKSEVPYRRAEQITRSAIVHLANRDHDARPFFLFINYMDAHSPYNPPGRFRDLFPGRNPAYTGWEPLNRLYNRLYSGKLDVTAEERAHLESQYDGGIAYIDASIAELLKFIRSADAFDNTLIIVTSDHGEAFGDRGLLEHGTSVHQDQIHVPLLIKFPGQTKATEVSTPVSGVDLFPTILSAAGVPIPKYSAGRVLTTRDEQPVNVISESFADLWLADGRPRQDRQQRALISGRWKYIASSTGAFELYDLTRDPNEMTNEAATSPRQLDGLRQQLAQWLEAATPKRQVRSQQLDAESQRRLRSLGYMH